MLILGGDRGVRLHLWTDPYQLQIAVQRVEQNIVTLPQTLFTRLFSLVRAETVSNIVHRKQMK